MTKTKKYNTIDLFAGCGGLIEGFEQTNMYSTLACVEWESSPCLTLSNRLKTKWNYQNADDLVLHFDIQRSEELFKGWKDSKYGSSVGLNKLVEGKKVDVIIGGPPCQAYSIAGRIRDKDGMKNDYRNYLFENYIKVVHRYKPSIFVFENVFGLLSAKPDGIPIIDEIKKSFDKIGYKIVDDIAKHALINIADYGIPQNRRRIILIGLKKSRFNNPKKIILDFYKKFMPIHKEETKTVKDAIGDLPSLEPLKEPYLLKGKKLSHSINGNYLNNYPRFHNKRDIQIFKELTQDTQSGGKKYSSIEELNKLYTKFTGKESNVHNYHVLNWDQPSNTIVAHLCKDGLRHIHPDPKQSRSITIREAARIQTFDDDFEFFGSSCDQYKMIGNAVPPKFAKKVALATLELLKKVREET